MSNTISILSQGLNDFFNATIDIAEDNAKNDARIGLLYKKPVLEDEVNKKLLDIKNNVNAESWEGEINSYFNQVMRGMRDSKSVYYCKNGYEAEAFTTVVKDYWNSALGKARQMNDEIQTSQEFVNVEKAKKALLDNNIGFGYVNAADELDRALLDGNKISPQEYEKRREQNYYMGYQDMYFKAFDGSVDQAISENKTFDKLYSDIRQSLPDMYSNEYSTKEIDKKVEDRCRKIYDAKVSDIQQNNAEKMSQIIEKMRFAKTQEEKELIAEEGRRALGSMTGKQIDEASRNRYSALLEFDLKGIKKASGYAGGKPTQSYEKIAKESPATIIQAVKNEGGNYYDQIALQSYCLGYEWFNNDYSENYNLDSDDRKKTYEYVYKGRTSIDPLTTEVLKELEKKHPTVMKTVNDKIKNLVKDIEKNKTQYDFDVTQRLTDYMSDLLLGSDKNMTDDQLIQTFDKFMNDCFVTKINYLQLNPKGDKLKKEFNPKKEKDVIAAIELSDEHDFVFTYGSFGNEEEYWAPGKEKALMASGGVVDTQKQALASTLGIPESEIENIKMKWKQDEAHNDLLSKPIFTYKDKDYELVKTDDGFAVKNLTDKDAKLIKGVVGNKAGKYEITEIPDDVQTIGDVKFAREKDNRTFERAKDKNKIDESKEVTKELESKRSDEAFEAVSNSAEMSESIKTALGKNAKYVKWEEYNDKISALDDASYNIDKDYKKMNDKQFEEKYNFTRKEWDKVRGVPDLLHKFLIEH